MFYTLTSQVLGVSFFPCSEICVYTSEITYTHLAQKYLCFSVIYSITSEVTVF